MPIVQFHLLTARYPDANVALLLREASDFYVATLYPGVEPPPLDRVRAFAVPVPPDWWATGGTLASEGGKAAPWFTCLALEGRPLAQLQALLAGFTDLVVKHLGAERDLVRGMVTQVPPALWSIGGTPATTARAPEVALRP